MLALIIINGVTCNVPIMWILKLKNRLPQNGALIGLKNIKKGGPNHTQQCFKITRPKRIMLNNKHIAIFTNSAERKTSLIAVTLQ